MAGLGEISDRNQCAMQGWAARGVPGLDQRLHPLLQYVQRGKLTLRYQTDRAFIQRSAPVVPIKPDNQFRGTYEGVDQGGMPAHA